MLGEAWINVVYRVHLEGLGVPGMKDIRVTIGLVGQVRTCTRQLGGGQDVRDCELCVV